MPRNLPCRSAHRSQAVAKPSCARELEPLCAALTAAVPVLPPTLAGAPLLLKPRGHAASAGRMPCVQVS